MLEIINNIIDDFLYGVFIKCRDIECMIIFCFDFGGKNVKIDLGKVLIL